MPVAEVGSVRLAYAEAGAGTPLVLCHEFAGDMASWDAQRAHFSARHRVVTWNARGFPPSDVPADWQAYAPEQQVADLSGLLDALEVERALLCGLSMGSHIALGFALAHPERCRALVLAGVGTGATSPEAFRADCDARAAAIEREGMQAMQPYMAGPVRVRQRQKDALGWKRDASRFLAHSARGAANTLRGFIGRRPSVFALESQLRLLDLPTLIVVGDEDDPCVEPALFLKRTLPNAGLALLPQTAHAVNVEEPELFNTLLERFFASVEAGRWQPRDRGSGDSWNLER